MNKKMLYLLTCFSGLCMSIHAQNISSKAKGLLNKARETESKISRSERSVENTSHAITQTESDKPDSAQIIFSNVPFTKGQASGKKEFKSGQRIYGRLILQRPLKKYEDTQYGEEIHCISFYINHSDSYYDESNMVVKEISTTEVNSNVIDFDVLCNKGERKDITHLQWSFANYIYHKQHANKKVGFIVRLSPRDGQCGGAHSLHHYNTVIESHGEFSIDFTGTDEEALKKLYYLDKTPIAGGTKPIKEMSIVTGESLQKTELPPVFSEADGNGYRDPKCSKENIEALIKKTFNTNEVLYFRFIKSGSTSDYSQINSGRGGHEKVGDQKFLFAFRDKDDQLCRFACGVIVRYLGYSSVAGEPEIRTTKVFEEQKSNYPQDLTARDVGIDYLYFIDEAKLKK
jgi:hypothetical protein